MITAGKNTKDLKEKGCILTGDLATWIQYWSQEEKSSHAKVFRIKCCTLKTYSTLRSNYFLLDIKFLLQWLPRAASPVLQSLRTPEVLTGNRLWNWCGCGCGGGCGGLSTRGCWRRCCRRGTAGGWRGGTYCLGLSLGLGRQHRRQLRLLNNFDPIWLSPRRLTCTCIIEIDLQFKSTAIKQPFFWRGSTRTGVTAPTLSTGKYYY